MPTLKLLLQTCADATMPVAMPVVIPCAGTASSKTGMVQHSDTSSGDSSGSGSGSRASSLEAAATAAVASKLLPGTLKVLVAIAHFCGGGAGGGGSGAGGGGGGHGDVSELILHSGIVRQMVLLLQHCHCAQRSARRKQAFAKQFHASCTRGEENKGDASGGRRKRKHKCTRTLIRGTLSAAASKEQKELAKGIAVLRYVLCTANARKTNQTRGTQSPWGWLFT
jgi:hypothetical protein